MENRSWEQMGPRWYCAKESVRQLLMTRWPSRLVYTCTESLTALNLRINDTVLELLQQTAGKQSIQVRQSIQWKQFVQSPGSQYWWYSAWNLHHKCDFLAPTNRYEPDFLWCEFKVWSMLYLCQCSAPYNLVLYINGLVQDYSISSALALEILQSCTKPSTLSWHTNSTVLRYRYDFHSCIQ